MIISRGCTGIVNVNVEPTPTWLVAPLARAALPRLFRRADLLPLFEEELHLAEQLHPVPLKHHPVCALADNDVALEGRIGELLENRLRHVQRREDVPLGQDQLHRYGGPCALHQIAGISFLISTLA